MARARHGKIARLPRSVRELVNRRLEDGESAEQILSWLNAQAEVKAVLTQHFDGVEISPQNLSEWRAGGFAEWQRETTREDTLRQLADYSHRLAASAGAHLSAGAAAVASGKILQVLELVADGDDEGIDFEGLVKSLAKLRALEIDVDKLALDKSKHAIKEREVALAERRFETLAVDTFLTWAKSEEARKILDLGQPRHVQAARLRELMFGPSPIQEGQVNDPTG